MAGQTPAITPYTRRADPRQAGLGPAANARPLEVADIGGFLRRSAGDVSQAASEMQQIEDARARKEAQDAAQLAATTSADLRLSWLQDLDERKRTAPPGADGFTGAFLGKLKADQEAALAKATTPAAKAAVQLELKQLAASFADDALRFEGGSRIEQRKQQIGTALDANRNSVFLQPGAYPDILKTQLAAIDHTDLPEDEKGKLRQASEQALTEAQWRGKVRQDPKAALEALGKEEVPGLTYATRQALLGDAEMEVRRDEARTEQLATEQRAQSRAELQALIEADPKAAIPEIKRRKAAMQSGLIDAVISAESSGDPTAVSSKGAVGLMQLLPGTARMMADRLGMKDLLALPDREFTERLKTDPALNRRLGTAYLQEQMDTFGGNSTLALAAYNAGPGKVEEWLKSYGDPRDGRVTEAEWLAAIPFRETRDYVAKIQTRAGKEDRMLSAELLRAEHQAAALARPGFEQRMQDQIALTAAGKPVANPVVREEFLSLYPGSSRDEGLRAWEAFSGRQAVATAMGQIVGAPIAEQRSKLEAFRPDPAKPNFADQQKAYDVTAEAVRRDQAERQQDPAAYAVLHSAPVAAAFKAAQGDPAKMGAAIQASLAEQTRLGIAENDRRPLTREAAGDLVQQWKKATSTDDRIGLLAGLTIGLKDDKSARRILDQLEDGGLPPGADRALEAYRMGDVDRSRRIMGALSVDPKDLPKLTDKRDQDTVGAVNSLYDGTPGFFGGSPTAAAAQQTAWSWTRQPGAARSIARDRETVLLLTRQDVANGMDPKAAAQRAYETVYGKRQAVVDEHHALDLPETANAGATVTTLDRIREGIDLVQLAPKREAFAPGGAGNGAFDAASRDFQRWAGRLREEGRWITVEGGFRLLDPTTGTAVPGPDGKSPRLWTLEEVAATKTPPKYQRGPTEPAPGAVPERPSPPPGAVIVPIPPPQPAPAAPGAAPPAPPPAPPPPPPEGEATGPLMSADQIAAILTPRKS